uniref:non-specific serine/threonine protein kinase n=1 Tax=Ziziphus jujuba TaxID=326968 RepID=A0A6P3ZJM2_ZIZJJ
MPFFVFLFLVLVSVSPNLTFSIVADHATPTRKLGSSSSSSSSLCPLDIDGFRKIIHESNLRLVFLDVQTECHYMFQAIRLLHSQYLQTTGYFFPPPAASDACWVAYEGLVDELLPGVRVRSTCGFKDSLMWESCLNITTRSQFEKLISQSDLQKIWSSCNQSLSNSSSCSSCLDSLSTVSESYFRGVNDGNASDCTGYPSIYAAAVANPYGPTNFDTAKCLFSIDLFPTHKKKKKHVVFRAVVTGSVCGFIGAIGVVWIFWRRHRKMKKKNIVENEMGFTPKRDFIGGNTKLFKLTFQEIKKSTNNFSRENIIGMGGYGNVYRGILPDGSEVAFKRFKNCSVAADKTFAHEVEVIASIRHVNLVALRGYCTETVPLEGHQRIIVCDLVHNRSLYDHLFGSGAEKKKLSWPTRQKIALGVARGLAYLHYGVQPGIIHRDVKPSNILLDETFEPKLVDFGLAKFAPEGYSHLSTGVAGTLGYVAPEYALYGQLSERSDVYSFGVVLLELLSGKKAVIEFEGVNTLLLTDWAWSLVKQGKVLDIIDGGMPELGLQDEMEKYVLAALVSAHPIVQARPTMDQIVKILEANFPVPPIPDRPFSHSK